MHELNIVSNVFKNNREMCEICSNLAIKTHVFRKYRNGTDIVLVSLLLLPLITWFGTILVCNFNKSNTPPWVFFTFFKLYK